MALTKVGLRALVSSARGRGPGSKSVGFAVTAFGTTASVYDRGRPGYPEPAATFLFDQLGVGPQSIVADVAAGTGKWTRCLLESGAAVLALEPVSGMRDLLVATLPDSRAVAGTAEALPFADGSLDVVTAAQAFHWFKADRALPEFHRVLRPGGGVGLVWNRSDTSVDWVRRIVSLRSTKPAKAWPHRLRRHLRQAVGRGSSAESSGEPDWDGRCRAAFSSRSEFTPLQHRVFRHGESRSADEVVDWVASYSRLSRLSPELRASVLEDVRQVLADFPPRFDFPFLTDVFWCTRA